MTYGAKGDGVTDDYDAIQAAVNACGTSGGSVVFPQGTYLLNKSGAGAFGESFKSLAPTTVLTVTGPFV